MAGIYDEYVSRYGQNFDAANEYLAIQRNIQNPLLRNQILSEWERRNPSAQEWRQRYTDKAGNVRSDYYADPAAKQQYNAMARGGWNRGADYDYRSIAAAMAPFVAQQAQQAPVQQSPAPVQQSPVQQTTTPVQQTTTKVPQATAPFAPSALASKESGSIGATSIASQMNGATKQKPVDTAQQSYKASMGAKTIFGGTTVEPTPRPTKKKKPGAFSGMNTSTLRNTLGL